MTEEEIEANALADPDNPPLTDEQLERMVPVMPGPKIAISIRIDRDVLQWFRSRGDGWQPTMNYVLRRYMWEEQGRPPLYATVEEMPPDIRAAYERYRVSADAQNGVFAARTVRETPRHTKARRGDARPPRPRTRTHGGRKTQHPRKATAKK